MQCRVHGVTFSAFFSSEVLVAEFPGQRAGALWVWVWPHCWNVPPRGCAHRLFLWPRDPITSWSTLPGALMVHCHPVRVSV